MEPISILMLEDSVLDADLTLMRLRRAHIDFQHTLVETREQFTQALSERKFDIILADYALPDFDGLAALDIARSLAPGTPFILVSGVLGEEFAIDALHRGAKDYVLKPRLDRLPNSINRAISEARNAAERERSEQALRHSRELARRIVESSRDCVMIVQPSGEVVSINSYGRTLMGLPPEADVAGRKYLSFWSSDCLKSAVSAFQTALHGGAGSFEAYSQTPDGQTRYWDVLITPVLGDSGEPEQLVSTARDFTERQQLLAREREARAEAEARSIELQQSLDDLQHFAYAASHDLREPLRVIALYAQLVQRRSKGRVDAESKKGLDYIEQGARRLEELLSDIQRYSSVVHGEKDFVPCDMASVADQAARICHLMASECGASIVHNGLPTVHGSPSQLVQVLQNLIENAIKYRSDAPLQIEIDSAEDNEFWTIRVSDNGMGFDPQYAERIFGLFKRLHGSEYPGTGMGLAICRRIIGRHGGKIWAESEPGKGSTFFFTIPKRS